MLTDLIQKVFPECIGMRASVDHEEERISNDSRRTEHDIPRLRSWGIGRKTDAWGNISRSTKTPWICSNDVLTVSSAYQWSTCHVVTHNQTIPDVREKIFASVLLRVRDSEIAP